MDYGNEYIWYELISPFAQENKALSIHVCDDEVYYFKRPIVPLKVVSPKLIEETNKAQLEEQEATAESQSLPFDESSNQMDTSFGDSFAAGFNVSWQEKNMKIPLE